MPDKFIEMTAELHRYAVEHSRSDPALEALAAETEELGGVAVMQTAPEQAALITLLVRAIGAARALEVGTFTGYGAIAIARGLPAHGRLVTCDVSEEWTEIARRHWEQAGLADRIELRLGPALETLRSLAPDEPFDFAYIDADKESYPDYYEESLRLLRSGGLIMLDNVFLGGEVVDPDADRRAVQVMRELNDRIAADERVESAMLGISDGITLVLKL
ncbi:MAG: class I SAM-dependent methyltransferase [Actinomycetota bacterium]